jgi:hypothetical protein
MSQPIGNLPLNAKVKLGKIYGHDIQWLVKSKNHAGYPSSAITLVTDKIIKIMASDGKEANNSDSNRKSYGNNRHIYSNIRQWLNKSGTGWYTAQHSADAAPTTDNCAGYNGYDTISGFLSGFSAEEIAAIITTTLTVNKATVDGGGQETYQDKIFLLSGTEVGFTTDTAEGSILDGFSSENASRIAYPTADAVSNSTYTSSSLKTDAAWIWWLRTPYASYSFNVRRVNTSGALNNAAACDGDRGLRPACNLLSSNLVSDTVDADGCYTLLFNEPPSAPSFINVPEQIAIGSTPEISWGASIDPEGTEISYILERKFNSGAFTEIYEGTNQTFIDTAIPAGNTSVQYRVKGIDADGIESVWTTSAPRSIITNMPPTITGTDTDLGTFANEAPDPYAYTVDDAQGGTVTVIESLDDVIVRTYQPTLGQEQSFSFSDAAWRMVLNGTHVIRIVAQDAQSGQTTRTLTLTKNVNTVEFYGPINPFPADATPTQAIVQVAGAMPAGSILTVEICNNGNDDTPTWEDCTAAVQNNQKHYFTNMVKTAESWGVKLHVKLQRGNAQGAVYISSVGGNFK